MKIHILYNFKNHPWGGGNQFLEALRKKLRENNFYEERPEKADAVLFNSHHNLESCYRLKQIDMRKIIVYRLDGPVSLVRGKEKEVDEIIKLFNVFFVDGIIFQSNWCKKKYKDFFGISSSYETVIHNASDNEIFNRIGKKDFNKKGKIKLITTSWSSNWRKGFETYLYLDENLDFSKYEMSFIGNSPIGFKNISHVRPVLPVKISEILKNQDIYITASQNDPCSNSLIEALSCGLPAVALNNGGHSELVRAGGELFNGKEDVIEKIEKVASNYHDYQSQISKFSIKEVAQKYYEFIQRIWLDAQDKRYRPKELNFSSQLNYYRMKFMILRWKGLEKIRPFKSILWKK